MKTGVIAVDETGLIRVMNESAWFQFGAAVRQRSLKSLWPRLDQALENWKMKHDVRPQARGARTGARPIGTAQFRRAARQPGRGCNDLFDRQQRGGTARGGSFCQLPGQVVRIAHEIRNPLAALNHASQLLEESPQIRRPKCG